MAGTLAILGAGGHGAVVADAAAESGWAEIRFYDDRFPAHDRCGPWPVAGTIGDYLGDGARGGNVIVAIGDNAARLDLLGRLATRATPATVIHPRAWVSRHAALGQGTVVMAGAVVNAGAGVGRGAIINTGATVDHDCVLADGVHVSPGANLAGRVRIGRCTWIGIGAAVRDGITVGDGVVVGAGAVVVADIPDGLTVAGNPARRMER